MSIQLFGRWNLEVTKAIHNLENRFQVQGADSGNGTFPPTVGLNLTPAGTAWLLTAEYREATAQPWKSSDMMIDPGPLDRVDIQATIGAEDPLPSRDFEDIQWAARYLDGTLLEIPHRPYAVRTQDLFQMPDGIFETALGTYYMAVRVVNRWGLPFTSDHVLNISAASRAALAVGGIHVIDAWSHAELTSLGQSQRGTGMVLGPLVPGSARTVYFKIDVSAAAPRKHEVEFVLQNVTGMADPLHPARRVRKQIFVSRTAVDPQTGEIVAEVQEGTLRFKLREIAIDRKNGRKGRKRCPPPRRRPGEKDVRDRLRHTLQALLDGRPIDPCVIQELLACYCTQGPGGGHPLDPMRPTDGRFCYDPFFAFPTRFSYTITPRVPFEGQYGPIPFQDPWWKVLLLVIAVLLLLAGALSEAADVAYHDEDLVIGSLGRSQQNDVDAALCVLDTDRALGFGQVLDVQSNEDNQNFENALDGQITLASTIMPIAEVMALLADPNTPDAQLQVFKSGATTGLTHGLMSGFTSMPFTREDDGTQFNLPQLRISPDPAFGENVSRPGDSGSIWVHRATGRPVALHHSGTDDPDRATASFLEDVFKQLKVTL
ncbi:hypothetical protein [Archangium lansingense]|uniref:Uncharacterized protein n=1 Tax=Archangium lansingense TaxID=2995310 RepID=A0ABT4AAS7_9BACT|nr:hypothetical protein [Archangium lansinium]MCY1078764.1 hypothetical protein [Archangium lansinium]